MTGRNVSDTLGDGVFQAKICKHKQKLLDLRDSFDDNRWTQQQDKQIGLAVEKLTHIAIDYPDQRNDILDFLVQALNYEHVSTFGHAVEERIIKGIAKFGLECIERVTLDGLAEKYKPEMDSYEARDRVNDRIDGLRVKKAKKGESVTDDDRIKIWESIENYPCRSNDKRFPFAVAGIFYRHSYEKIAVDSCHVYETYSIRSRFPQRRIMAEKPSLGDYKNGAIAALDALQQITNLKTVSVGEWIGRSNAGYDAIPYAANLLPPLCNIIHGYHPSYNPLTGFYHLCDKEINEHLKNWNNPDYTVTQKDFLDESIQKTMSLSELFSQWSTGSHTPEKIAACREILEKGIESIGKMPHQKADYELARLAKEYPRIIEQVLPILESHDTPNARGGLEELRHLEQ